MKYAEIDIKTARKCCKQHSYRDKHGRLIPNCDICPLRRKNTKGGKGFCWFQLKSLHDSTTDWTTNKQCDYLNAEYNALMQEDISELLEWENWINSQESVD